MAPQEAIDPSMDQNNGDNSISGISIGFADLSYSVPIKSKDGETSLKILHSLSGSFLPGKMSALMGPSGKSYTRIYFKH